MYALKTHFQKLAIFFAFKNLSANGATFLGWLFTLLAASTIIYLNGQSENLFHSSILNQILFFSMPLWIFLRFIYNALDGLIARQQGTATFLGELFNENGDVLSDSILFLSFSQYTWMNPLLMGFVIGSIWFCEFNGIMGKAFPTGTRRYDSLGGGKTERALILGAIFLADFAFNASDMTKIFLFGLVGVLSFLTGIRRAVKAYHFSKGKEYKSFTLYGR